MTYNVSIEKNGMQTYVGKLTGDHPENAVFAYDSEYLVTEGAAPISLSLPLQEGAFSPAQTKNYFDSLLPEGYTRRTVAQWIHADEDDYLTILHALGCECLGALQITAEGEAHGASYEPLALDQVKALAAEGASKSAELVITSHLSLAGATGKVGLYYDGKTWFLPRGTAPSTHIVKQSHVRLKHIVQNEQLALMTARNCGLLVADSFIINTGSGADEEILFAAARYDRIFPKAGRVIDGLTAPLRLHQEDFAQALGIPASQKYERAGENHLARMFDLLRRHSANPIRDMTRLWDQIVFNWLIGNTDAHVKNFSLLYSPDLRTLRLAPAYDLLAAAIYPTTRELSFRIGGAATLDAVTDATFEAAAREAGLGVRMAMQRYHRMLDAFVPALRAASESLQAEGFPEAAEIAEQILQTGGIAAAK